MKQFGERKRERDAKKRHGDGSKEREVRTERRKGGGKESE